MSRKFLEDELVLATHNVGKIEEIKHLLGDVDFLVHDVNQFDWTEPEETGKSFFENSLIKAREATAITGMVSLADDSGICVDLLKGNPGIYSADWAVVGKGRRNFQLAIKRLISEIRNTKSNAPWDAHFKCSLVLNWPDGHYENFEASVHGKIVWPGVGENGHGYDPIFMPSGYRETFGEMDRWEKNKLSHRGLAIKKMLKNCF
ncbi:non-canonical purine NTP pyrophosphatase [Paracoccaceae bacterium]|nr:non-canonical purine NTP pyrophosphatase [Paracoccaceae bacterium]